MAIVTGGLHHLAIRVTDLARAKQFYTVTLGFPKVLETAELFLCNASGTLIGVRGPEPETAAAGRFDPHRVGLDHIALTVPTVDALEGLRRQLETAGVPNNGVEHDALTGATYISFYDPDGIAWELYASAP
ncbi:MAG: VOC family protein [Dehalococcoidia bacterium]